MTIASPGNENARRLPEAKRFSADLYQGRLGSLFFPGNPPSYQEGVEVGVALPDPNRFASAILISRSADGALSYELTPRIKQSEIDSVHVYHEAHLEPNRTDQEDPVVTSFTGSFYLATFRRLMGPNRVETQTGLVARNQLLSDLHRPGGIPPISILKAVAGTVLPTPDALRTELLLGKQAPDVSEQESRQLALPLVGKH